MRLLPHLIACTGLLCAALGNTYASDQAPLKSLPVNGHDMRYVEQGKGPLLVLVHGSFSDHRTWKSQIEILAKDFRVVAPTMRYFGTAPWNDSWPAFSDVLLADDLAEFVAGLKSGPAHLVGWSRGGRVSHLTTLRHPDMARSAYLFEGTARIKLTETDAKLQRAIGGQMFGPAVKELKEKGPEASIPKWIDAVAGAGTYEKRTAEQKEMFKDNARTIPITLQAKRTVLDCEQLRLSKVPTTIVRGTKSAFVDFFKPMTDCLPEKIVTITGATHSWPAMDVKAFAASVREFALKN